jgi:acetate kinase
MSILVLNCGSSSVKYTLFGHPGGKVLLHGTDERVEDYAVSFARLFAGVGRALPRGLDSILGVGHRVVHGGARFVQARRVDAAMMDELRLTAPLAPLHNPHNIRGIEHACRVLPGVPQVAVFDTAFHAALPAHAFSYALPASVREKTGIRRYGFHGISYAWVHRRLYHLLGRRSPRGFSAILCHLGNGCSAAAVKDGVCVDTSMGFTPLEGLVMGTRCGDLDPAVVLRLLGPTAPSSAGARGLTRSRLFHLLNSESGLLGLSGLSADVRDLTKAAGEGHEGARLALSVFAYRLKKCIAAYHGVLGGADTLVFTAGIGENSPSLRAQALAGMEGLGFALDPEKNAATTGGREGEITGGGGKVRVFVIPTDEDRMIYREAAHLIGSGNGRPSPA